MFKDLKIKDIIGLDFRGYYKVSIFVFVIISIIATGMLTFYIFFRELYITMNFIKIIFLGIGVTLPGYLIVEVMIIMPVIEKDMNIIRISKNKIDEMEMKVKKMDRLVKLSKESPEVLSYLEKNLERDEYIKPKSLTDYIKDNLKIKNEMMENEETDEEIERLMGMDDIEKEEIEKLISEYKNADRSKIYSSLVKISQQELKDGLENEKKIIAKKDDDIYKSMFLQGTLFYLIEYYISLYITINYMTTNLMDFIFVYVLGTVLSGIVIRIYLKITEN